MEIKNPEETAVQFYANMFLQNVLLKSVANYRAMMGKYIIYYWGRIVSS